eukprot:5584789-Pleurochrysis_carterae.AAC.1
MDVLMDFPCVRSCGGARCWRSSYVRRRSAVYVHNWTSLSSHSCCLRRTGSGNALRRAWASLMPTTAPTPTT